MSDYELKRINALPEASAINDSDVFAIDSAAGTKKVAWETLKGEVDADISEAVSNKADKDGTYPDMAVGSVLGTNTVTDREPYFLRPSASIGDREFDALVGGTLGWNQLVQNGDFADTSNWNISVYTLSAANNVLTVTIPETHGAHFQLYQSGLFATAGHKYLICANVKPSFAITSFQLRINANEIATEQSLTASVWNSFEKIFSASDGNTMPFTFRIGVSELQTGTVDFKTVNFIDLTTLFGSTIADYIYSLETAHAGDGVAWVRKYLPETYYAYCAPTLKHVSGVSAHVMRDANNNIIGNYPIDSTWVGMGVPKLDSDGKLYFDGDRYASDGTVTERYGIVDLGTLNWDYASSRFNAAPTGLKIVGAWNSAGIICANYPVGEVQAPPVNDKVIGVYSNKIYVADSAYTDAATFKTAMSGVYLVYELATPTTSTASPFTSPQICDPDGTEEYVTTGLVPVGHETEYVENLADKLTNIPDLPTTAGTYRLKVTVSGGVPSYSWVSA